MKRTIIQCEQCSYTQQTEPAMFGPGHDWIKVSKAIYTSGDLLQSGNNHFCAEKCLKNFMAGVKKIKRLKGLSELGISQG